jgi:hypothetical protein
MGIAVYRGEVCRTPKNPVFIHLHFNPFLQGDENHNQFFGKMPIFAADN